MGVFDELKFNLLDQVQRICTLIEKCRSKKVEIKKHYEKSLVGYLCNELAGIKIAPQYAIRRTETDLVADSVIVEM
jgi:hypothetical protein